ncbi:MAG: VOC family protein [Nocardioides sp.]
MPTRSSDRHDDGGEHRPRPRTQRLTPTKDHRRYTTTWDLTDDGPALLVQPSAEPVKPGAIHLDLRPEDQGACVARAVALGARVTDIGQTGEEGWVVMADPGDNLFCVLQSRADYFRSCGDNPGTPTPIE